MIQHIHPNIPSKERGNGVSTRDRLSGIWPLYGLALMTPRLELRLPTETDLVDLAAVLRDGIQEPGNPPFHEAWLYEPSPQVERGLLRSFFGSLATWNADDWNLQFAVYFDGKPIGMQHVFSRSFAVTRCFGSSCWLGLPYQRQGLGTEMGHAILALGFDGLGALEAYAGAWADNVASIRVMEKLDYVPNGQYVMPHGGTARQDQRMRLTRESWLDTERPPVRITGLEACRPLLGISNDATTTEPK